MANLALFHRVAIRSVIKGISDINALFVCFARRIGPLSTWWQKTPVDPKQTLSGFPKNLR